MRRNTQNILAVSAIAATSVVLVFLSIRGRRALSTRDGAVSRLSSPPVIRILTRGPTESEWQTSGTFIAAGGLDDPVHQADVRIEIDPPPGPGHPIEIRLRGEGGGHTLGFWPLRLKAVKAKLVLEDETYEHGQRRPLRFYARRVLEGRLISSNLKESTAIQVRVPSFGIIESTKVRFEDGDLHMQISSWKRGTWKPIKLYGSLEGVPLAGHDLVVAAAKVELKDGTVVKARLGKNLLSCVGLDEYVELNPDSLNHRYFRAKAADAFPSAVAKFRVIHPDVVRVDFIVADLSVMAPWEDSEHK